MTIDALGRTGFSSMLNRRKLKLKGVVLRRTTVIESGQEVQEYAPHSVLKYGVEPVSDFGRNSKSDGDQFQTAKQLTLFFDHNVDLKTSDRFVVNATNILEGPPISYVGGEEVEILNLDNLQDDPTYVAALVERKQKQ